MTLRDKEMTSFVISDIFYYKVIPFKLNDATTTYQLTSHHCNKDNMCSYSDHRLHFLSGHWLLPTFLLVVM